jgi:tetratricopeptide (TPR) repeat protein
VTPTSQSEQSGNFPQPPVDDSSNTNISGGDSAIITAALAALSEDKATIAAKFINQILEQGDLEAARGILSAASPEQLMEPELAFIRGRLIWQSAATGQGKETLFDAQRNWETAVAADPVFLEAWIALGFASYKLGDFNAALEAWNRAIEVDRMSLEDIDPSGQMQLASEFTANAYAGLAMANRKMSELSPVKNQKEQYQQQAEDYYSQAVTLSPKLLNPESLALSWIWLPDLIDSWGTAIEHINNNVSTLKSLVAVGRRKVL